MKSANPALPAPAPTPAPSQSQAPTQSQAPAPVPAPQQAPKQTPKKPKRSAEELAFLPAALEIVETPPSPIGRAIGGTIMLLFVLALAWACLGEIDIVAAAQGKIVPTGRIKVIQPLEIAVVRAIHVRDGQTVKAGDTLIELDPTINAAEASRLKSELVAAQVNVARLRAALVESDTFQAPPNASQELVATQRNFLVSQVGEFRAKLGALSRQAEQKEAEAATSAALVSKLEAIIPVLRQRFEIRRTLANAEIGSKLQYLEMLQALTEQEQELAVQKSRLREAQAAVRTLVETQKQTKAEYQKTVLDETSKFEPKASSLEQELIKAEQKTKLQLLVAPVDGVVQQLAVYTPGGVVTPAQALLVVVPSDSHLEVEAMISNRDIGFIEPGQAAEIKVDTFSFTKYGLIPGRVISVSQDSISRNKPERPGEKAQGSEISSSEPSGQELNYSARVALDRTQIQVENKRVNLSPGMAVTVEIKTGSRTVLSYLLSPLLRFRQESLRER
jgi:hemolysin D